MSHKSNEANDILRTKGKASPIWFEPQMIVDIAAIVLRAMEDNKIVQLLDKYDAITSDRLGEIALKLQKEVDRV